MRCLPGLFAGLLRVREASGTRQNAVTGDNAVLRRLQLRASPRIRAQKPVTLHPGAGAGFTPAVSTALRSLASILSFRECRHSPLSGFERLCSMRSSKNAGANGRSAGECPDHAVAASSVPVTAHSTGRFTHTVLRSVSRADWPTCRVRKNMIGRNKITS